MKNTKQRKLILDIINNSYDHLDAYGVYEKARVSLPNISLGTVYRNLKDLEENKKITSIEVNGVKHYDKNIEHGHFTCDNCHKIIDVYDLKFKKITNYNSNIVTDYKIVLSGICNDCQKGGVKNGT